MKMDNKIGCILVTCDRNQMYEISAKSLFDAAEELGIVYGVVNDGTETLPFVPKNYIQTNGHEGVAVAKNKGLKFLLDQGCNDVFLIEDDVEIIDKTIFEKYIETAQKTGLKHLNFALHGDSNLNERGSPTPRRVITYPDGTKLSLYNNLLGAFSYYHRDVLETVGLMDETFFNSMDHVGNSYDIIKAGFHPPFRYFADIFESEKYLKDILPAHGDSKIRNNRDFQEVFKKGLDRFIEKYGFSVVQGYGPPEIFHSEEECLDFLRLVYNNKKNER